MDALKRTFFEDPLYVYVALAGALAVLAVLWRERRTRRLKLMLAVPPALALAVLALERAVVTDREQIQQASAEVAMAIQDGRYQDILPHLDDRFTATVRGQAFDKPLAAAVAQRYHGQLSLERIRLQRSDVVVDGPRDRASMKARTRITTSHGAFTVEWDLEWARRQGRWRLVLVRDPKISPM